MALFKDAQLQTHNAALIIVVLTINQADHARGAGERRSFKSNSSTNSAWCPECLRTINQDTRLVYCPLGDSFVHVVTCCGVKKQMHVYPWTNTNITAHMWRPGLLIKSQNIWGVGGDPTDLRDFLRDVNVSLFLLICEAATKTLWSGLSPIPALSSPFIKTTRRGQVQRSALSSLLPVHSLHLSLSFYVQAAVLPISSPSCSFLNAVSV